MRNRIALAAALLGTTFLVSPALAQDNTVVVTTLNSTNTAVVNATIDFDESVLINGNVGNRIGALAGGAVTSATIANEVQGAVVGTLPLNSLTATSLEAQNSGAVTTSVTGFGSTIDINGGTMNTVSASAVGASSTVGITQSAFNTGIDTTLNNNDVNITGTILANNTAAVTLNAFTVSGAVDIGGGNSNSVSFQAVGASGQAGITQALQNLDNGTVVQTHTVDLTSLTVSNSANVNAVGVTFSDPVVITAGTGNSISIGAVGSSATVSITQATNTIGTAALGDNRVNATSIASTNTAPSVQATGHFVDPVTISAGVGGGISVQAIGAVAAASIIARHSN
jgi:hypothetical protein